MTEKEIIQKIYEAIKLVDCMQYNPLVDFNYLRAKGAYNIIKNQIEHLEAENAELRARLENAVELPCELGNTTVYAIECYSCGYCMREYYAAEIAVTEDGEFAFYSPEIPARRLIFGKDIFTSKEAAEARLKEIKSN